MDLAHLIKRPIITEKSIQDTALNRYTFAVALRANKNQIKQAIEKTFNVNVINVHTILVKGKSRRIGRRRLKHQLPHWKKAIVELKPEQKIDLFETAQETVSRKQK